MGRHFRDTSQAGLSRFWLVGSGLLCFLALASLSACEDPESLPATTEITETSAREVLDLAAASAKDAHSGQIEGEFTLETEFEDTRVFLTTGISGVFETPDRSHLRVTHSLQGPPSLDIDGTQVDFVSRSWAEEWTTVGGHVYVDSSEGEYRHPRDRITLSFELFELFKFDLLDLDGEISTSEQEIDGERVYFLTGPAAQDGRYPLLDRAPGIDGVVDYWIGAEGHLLRRLEVSIVSVGLTGDAPTKRLNGFVTLSAFGKSVDIRPPEQEGADDHGNSPATATEISVGESVNASVETWLDADYFSFRAEEGRLYHIDVSDEGAYNKAYGTHSTLFGSDGITEELALSKRSGQQGTRILWQVSASGTYYLRVENGQEEEIAYSLTIYLLPEEDDYGDDPSTAHKIDLDEVVEGLIGQLNDRDYFKFSADEGLVYLVEVFPHLRENSPDVVLHGPDGPLQEARPIGSRGSYTERILWVAPTHGSYYVSVEYRHGRGVGSYTLMATSITHHDDDHSDGAANATRLSMGETVGGSLDYEFDIDYFSFGAEKGHGYSVNLDYGSSHLSDLKLYASDGFTPVPLAKYTLEDRDGRRLVWMATEIATHYLEVKSVFGRTGDYTITASTVTAAHDDHGNDAENATDIQIAETVQGAMDYEFDLDYFRLNAVVGQKYLMQVKHKALGLATIKVYAADGVTERPPYSFSSGHNITSTYRWIADTSSQYFVAVESGSGSLGDYTIVINEIDE